jgi:hypothetical protein
MEPYPCRYGRPERHLGRIRRPTKPKTSKFRHDSLPAPLNAQVRGVSARSARIQLCAILCSKLSPLRCFSCHYPGSRGCPARRRRRRLTPRRERPSRRQRGPAICWASKWRRRLLRWRWRLLRWRKLRRVLQSRLLQSRLRTGDSGRHPRRFLRSVSFCDFASTVSVIAPRKRKRAARKRLSTRR